MEEIDYKRSIELLNKDVDACLEIEELRQIDKFCGISKGV